MVAPAALAAAVFLACAGCLTPLTSRPPLTPVPVQPHPLVGVYEPGAPGSWSGIAGFTGATGVAPRIVVYYSPWNNPFAASFAQTAWGHDAYVLVQLEPSSVTLASVAAGGSDAYLRSYADAVAAFGHPVILSFGHEMNGDWYSWGHGRTSPATFVAAWRHVVQVFRAAGAANVTWLGGQLGQRRVERAAPVVAGCGVGGLDGHRRLLLPVRRHLRFGVWPHHRGHPRDQRRAPATPPANAAPANASLRPQ